MTSIGERIRAARKAKALSQPAVAREAGCSLATYKRYEQIVEEEPPEGFQYLWRIADLLELDLHGGSRTADADIAAALDAASELQLVAALHRRIAARTAAGYEDDFGLSEAPIEVRAMPFPGFRPDADEADRG